MALRLDVWSVFGLVDRRLSDGFLELMWQRTRKQIDKVKVDSF